MEPNEALMIVCMATKKWLDHLEDTIDSGPEGLEVYLQPGIDKISQALDIVEDTYGEG